MLVTDAMPSVGADTRSFQIQGRTITVVPGVDGDKIVDDEGRLAGAHLDMAGAVRNAVRILGLDLADAMRMASANPAAFLKLTGRSAASLPVSAPSLALLDEDLQVTRTWIDGQGSQPFMAGARIAQG